jgi:hypothetical protein
MGRTSVFASEFAIIFLAKLDTEFSGQAWSVAHCRYKLLTRIIYECVRYAGVLAALSASGSLCASLEVTLNSTSSSLQAGLLYNGEKQAVLFLSLRIPRLSSP